MAREFTIKEMDKISSSYKELKGSQDFRMRLLLSTLSSTPIFIKEIRNKTTYVGLRPCELSLLHLIGKLSDDCIIQINDSGTKLKYKPGTLMGGIDLVHDCGTGLSIGYFLEPLIVLGLFGKEPLTIRLIGVTNDSKDPSVDTFQSTTLPMLKKFGVPSDRLELRIERRGVPSHGVGEIFLSIPNIQASLKAVDWMEEGLVKRIRGVTFSTSVPFEYENTMIYVARRILNSVLPDVRIFTEPQFGPQVGESPGYGISLYAETNSGCVISEDTTISYPRQEDVCELDDKKKELSPPGYVGEQIAFSLFEEISKGGVVDSTHQGLLFLLCALCPRDVSKVCVGKLSPHGKKVLRDIRDFLGVVFDIERVRSPERVILKCVGCDLKNLAKKVS